MIAQVFDPSIPLGSVLHFVGMTALVSFVLWRVERRVFVVELLVIQMWQKLNPGKQLPASVRHRLPFRELGESE